MFIWPKEISIMSHHVWHETILCTVQFMSSCHTSVPWHTWTSHFAGVKHVINHGLIKRRWTDSDWTNWFRLNLLITLPYLPCFFVSSYLFRCLDQIRLTGLPGGAPWRPLFRRPKLKQRSSNDLGQCWVWQIDFMISTITGFNQHIQRGNLTC